MSGVVQKASIGRPSTRRLRPLPGAALVGVACRNPHLARQLGRAGPLLAEGARPRCWRRDRPQAAVRKATMGSRANSIRRSKCVEWKNG
jgi:hypothetical protein